MVGGARVSFFGVGKNVCNNVCRRTALIQNNSPRVAHPTIGHSRHDYRLLETNFFPHKFCGCCLQRELHGVFDGLFDRILWKSVWVLTSY